MVNSNAILTYQGSMTTEEVDFDVIVKEAEQCTVYQIGGFIHMIYFPILVPLGMVGNSLSAWIMSRPHNRRFGFCIYMGVLAITDNIMLLIALYYWMITVPLKNYHHALSDSECGFCAYLFQVFSTYGIFCLVAMSFNRYLAVCKPLKAHMICTPRKAKRILIIVFVIDLVYSLPYCFYSHLLNGEYCVPFSTKDTFTFVYVPLNMFTNIVVPFVAILIMNILIIRIIRKRRKIPLGQIHMVSTRACSGIGVTSDVISDSNDHDSDANPEVKCYRSAVYQDKLSNGTGTSTDTPVLSGDMEIGVENLVRTRKIDISCENVADGTEIIKEIVVDETKIIRKNIADETEVIKENLADHATEVTKKNLADETEVIMENLADETEVIMENLADRSKVIMENLVDGHHIIRKNLSDATEVIRNDLEDRYVISQNQADRTEVVRTYLAQETEVIREDLARQTDVQIDNRNNGSNTSKDENDINQYDLTTVDKGPIEDGSNWVVKSTINELNDTGRKTALCSNESGETPQDKNTYRKKGCLCKGVISGRFNVSGSGQKDNKENVTSLGEELVSNRKCETHSTLTDQPICSNVKSPEMVLPTHCNSLSSYEQPEMQNVKQHIKLTVSLSSSNLSHDSKDVRRSSQDQLVVMLLLVSFAFAVLTLPQYIKYGVFLNNKHWHDADR